MTRSLLWSLALVALACGGTPKSSENLLVDVRGFGDGVRWRKAAQAASRLPPAQRDAFLDARAELDDELRVDDYEILRVSLRGPDGDRAEVRIEWTWHLDRKGIVHSTITGQDWERHGKQWILVAQQHVSGEPMPGFDEPPEEAETDAGPATDPAADPALGGDDPGLDAGPTAPEARQSAPPMDVASAAEAI